MGVIVLSSGNPELGLKHSYPPCSHLNPSPFFLHFQRSVVTNRGEPQQASGRSCETLHLTADMEWEQECHSLLRDEMDFCQGGELSHQTENREGETGSWGMGNQSEAERLGYRIARIGEQPLYESWSGSLFLFVTSLGKWKGIAMFAINLILICPTLLMRMGLSRRWYRDRIWDAKHLLKINVCERKGDKARWAKSEL